MAKGTRPALSGRRLGNADLAQLRLSLPCALPPEVLNPLRKHSLLGGGIRLTAAASSGDSCFVEHTLAFYTPERLLLEALDYSPGVERVKDGYLPIADADRSNDLLYFVSVKASSAGQLFASGTGGETALEPLGIALKDVVNLGRAATNARPRRRLPKRRHHAPRVRAKKSTAEWEALPLFP